jgi:hypothetical protein
MEHGQILTTDIDFENAIKFQLEVSITQDGEHMGTEQILSQSQHCIETANAYYFKDACEFMVMTMVH